MARESVELPGLETFRWCWLVVCPPRLPLVNAPSTKECHCFQDEDRFTAYLIYQTLGGCVKGRVD